MIISDGWQRNIISIHALHAESDIIACMLIFKHLISIHALHAESDFMTRQQIGQALISIHALHAESDSKNHIFILKYVLLFV